MGCRACGAAIFSRRSVMSRRITVGVLVFGLTALAVSTQQPGTAGAVQKNNPAVLQLQQQNQQLKAANQQLQQQVQQLQSQLKQSQKDDAKDSKAAKADSKTAKDAQSIADGYKNAGL